MLGDAWQERTSEAQGKSSVGRGVEAEEPVATESNGGWGHVGRHHSQRVPIHQQSWV